jgi:hypothetical protein
VCHRTAELALVCDNALFLLNHSGVNYCDIRTDHNYSMFMGKVIAISIQKGESGKPQRYQSRCQSAVLEYKVLQVDSDPQANATS